MLDDLSATFSPAPPARHWHLARQGLPLQVCEWGEPSAAPLLLVHGAFDSHASFGDLAPRLARGGWRVISYDQRGHGDSAHSEHHGWMADVSDLIAVVEQLGTGRALPVLGHSKGGSLLNYAALASPQHFRCILNLDGLSFDPDADLASVYEDTLSTLRVWLHNAVQPRAARLASLETLVAARQRANPRLAAPVVEFLVRHLARETPDGWHWKYDASLPLKRIAPHPGHWLLGHMRRLTVPMLAIKAGVRETLAWPVSIDALRQALPPSTALEVWPEVGHFVHLEAPAQTAARVLGFLEAHRDG